MVKIRLRRMGAKKNPFYRIIVSDSRSPRDGRFIEQVGTYNPLTEPSEIKLDLERVKYWMSTGAQPTDTVRKLIKITENAVVPPALVNAPEEEAAAATEPVELEAEEAPPEAEPAEAEETE